MSEYLAILNKKNITPNPFEQDSYLWWAYKAGVDMNNLRIDNRYMTREEINTRFPWPTKLQVLPMHHLPCYKHFGGWLEEGKDN